jgi:hypothetical protein
MRHFVDVHMVRLIEAEQRRLRAVADLLTGLVDRPEAIDETAVVELRMAHDLADAQSVQRLGVDADRRFAREFQKYPRCRDILPDRFEHTRNFIECAGLQVR